MQCDHILPTISLLQCSPCPSSTSLSQLPVFLFLWIGVGQPVEYRNPTSVHILIKDDSPFSGNYLLPIGSQNKEVSGEHLPHLFRNLGHINLVQVTRAPWSS